MKILWVVNVPLRILGEKLYGRRNNDLWMGALLDGVKQNTKNDIIVATTAAISQTQKYIENGITYYALPSQVPILYNENDERNIAVWQELLDSEKPDLIQVWGTEFTHGLCALRVAKDIPSVIYMQGYLGSIARHYLAGMTHQELKKSVTFRDIIKRDSIENQQKKYFRSAEKEKEMFLLSGRIICENDWCENSIRAIVPDIMVYRCPLSINLVFSEKEWDLEQAERHSIICTASGYPLKGLHMMLKAVALLKEIYPDIKLYVPGEKVISDNSLKWLVRKRGYTKYIEKLIEELDISKSIVWMGSVTQEELAEQYSKTHAFVLTSSIENHSSSLKEAMMVGVPSIASNVGGVSEYVEHGKSGFLYRFEEYEMIAAYIKLIFEDDELAKRLSFSGKERIKSIHDGNRISENMEAVYNSIVLEGK